MRCANGVGRVSGKGRGRAGSVPPGGHGGIPRWFRATLAGPELSLGVVGAGHIVRMFHLPAVSSIDRLRLRFVADVDEDRARDVAASYDCEAVQVTGVSRLPDVDALLLAIPVGARGNYVRWAGSREVALFAEKPFAVDGESHRSALEHLETVYCNYMRTLFSSTRQLSRLLGSGLLGSLERVRWSESGIVGSTGKGAGHYQEDVRLSGGGILIQNGCHPLSQLSHVFASAELSVTRARVRYVDEVDVDVEAELSARSGRSSVDVSLCLSHVRERRTAALFRFEHGVAEVDPTDPEADIRVAPEPGAGAMFRMDRAAEWATSMAQAHYLRWLEFLQEVDGGCETSVVETGLRVTELIEEIYGRSSGHGNPESECAVTE